MCSTRLLYQSSDGFMTYCPECKSIQMAFGTTAVKFSEEHFKQFCEMVLEEKPIDPGCSIKNLWLPLPDKHTRMIISNMELAALHFGLEQAQASLEVYRTLNELDLHS